MRPIVLATDFGWHGPYVGQMKCAALHYAPQAVIVDLLHDLPNYNVRAASYLLANYCRSLQQGSVVVAVVDPGVGSAQRQPVVVEADGFLFVGPGNGLFDQLIAQAAQWRYWQITWRSATLSNSFHGRDLFAPVAAMLTNGAPLEQLAMPAAHISQGWPVDLAEVIYIDHYGNGVTGLRATSFAQLRMLHVNGVALQRATTFADVAVGEPFFYENSSGLLEIAVNQGSAAQLLALTLGTPLHIA